MKTGFRGTFVISWAQTELDGAAGPALDALSVGAVWRWSGQSVRVDGPQELLLLGEAVGEANLRKRAAVMVRRLIGSAVDPAAGLPEVEPVTDHGFVVTDGRQSFTATLVGSPATSARLVMFLDELPPADTDLWVVRRTVDMAAESGSGASGGVICFTPGTRILTDTGPRGVETLQQGDRVLTKDDGPQEILWIGSRKMTGARLYAMPHLRPIRIRAGALGIDIPDGDLIVSPQHRLLVRGRAAQALFSAPEVLMAAVDMINDRSITVDHALREVTYIHLLLERHQIVWANGVETESFHPANTSMETLDAGQRQALLALRPELAADPHRYGDYARRNLSPSEAAILRHDGGLRLASLQGG